MEQDKDIETKRKNKVYSINDICPICGEYAPNGEICIICQKEHNIYEPKFTYIDGVQ